MTGDAMSGSPPHLRDDAVLLRPITRADVDTYVEHQDPEMANRFEWPGPATVDAVDEAVSRWVESWRSGGRERNFAIIDLSTAEMVGDCELELRDDGFVNVMYAVFSAWRGRGVATRAVRLLAAHAAEVFPDHALLFRIHPDNEASRRVAQRLGATRDGTERSRNGRLLERWIVRPAEPAAQR